MATALGKRKEREEDGTLTHGSTLFVSNLPYAATSVDLETLFSDIAPVRSAFVVLEQGTGVSKGVGYVSFAIKEDAQAAFDKITQEGLPLVGRNLRVQWADSKPKEKDESGKLTAKKESRPREPTAARAPAQPRLPHDPLAVRTIIISGLPPTIDSKVLWKKVRKYTGADSVEWPVKSEGGVEDPTTAHVLFVSPSSAQDAVSKLHAHVYKGCLLSVTLKKRLESTAKANIKNKKEPVEGTILKPNNSSRLIVRNVPFNADEQDLRAIFLPYGPIYSIHIPMDAPKDKVKEQEMDVDDAETKSKPRTKGYAFVWMLSRKDAEKAIEGCNGTVMRAGAAEDLLLDKHKRKKQKREEKKLKNAAAAAAAGEGQNDDEEAAENEKRAVERTIAVDWALSKDKWKEEKAKIEQAVDTSESDSDSSKSDSESSGSDQGLGVYDGSDGSDNSDSDNDDTEERDGDEEPEKPKLPLPESGTTLFVRNLPFTATEDELRTLFRTFGPLRYARITIDFSTGRSRGTGFVCFWNKDDADKAVQQSELLRTETTGHEAPKKNPFTLPSILTPDPSSSLAQSLVLQGRTLDVVRAVTRDQAGKLKIDSEKQREKADKRNMYLLREGVIMPNTPAAETLTPAEIERRTLSYNARRAQLKSNPSLYISKTRLSIRQIPLFVTERLLKRMAIYAVRDFEKQVKKQLRVGLTEDELVHIPEEGEEHDTVPPPVEIKEHEDTEMGSAETKAEKAKKRREIGRKTGVKQTKIVRIQERVDPVTGKGRSKGYGFVEMHKHADALRVLRWANNNQDLGKLFEEWWLDELKDLVKAEKAKSDSERDDARLGRLKEELDKGSSGGKRAGSGRGGLIVEFSIENVQVVQRRSASQKEKVSVKHDKKKPQEKITLPSKTETPPLKKRRVVEEKNKEASIKPANNIGSLIGRKRKERKGKK